MAALRNSQHPSFLCSQQQASLIYLLGPNIQIFGPKKHIFPLAANWSLTDQCFQHEKGVSLDSRYEGTKSFIPPPKKNWIFGPKTAKFGPFDLMPDQKTMRTSCPSGFSIMWVPKLLLTPLKIKIFGPKTAKFGPKYAFLFILA